MRILLICEGFNEYSIHVQPWKHVFEIARGLQHKGHEVCVLTDDNTLWNRDRIIGNILVKLTKKGRFLFDPEELGKNLSDDFDVVNWNASGLLSAFHFWRLRDIHRGLVWTLHAGIIDSSDLRNLRAADIPSMRMFWNNILYSIKPSIFVKKVANSSSVKAIITLSKRLKVRLIKSGINEKMIRVIYSGVDVNKYAPRGEGYMNDVKEELGFNPNEPIILYYGPLNSFRGADELIEAIPQVSPQFRQARFVFLGRTAKEDYKSEISKKSLLSHKNTCLIEGFLEQELLLKYLYAADIVVLPFRFWPYVECPLTVLEVMALGKPLITTYIGAIPEIVHNDENGLLVNPRSKEIATAIGKLLLNRDLAIKLGNNAHKYVKKFHSWEHVIDQTARVFEESLS